KLGERELLRELSLHAEVWAGSAPRAEEAHDREADAPVRAGDGDRVCAIGTERDVGVVDQLRRHGEDQVPLLLGHARELARGVLQANCAAGLVEESAGPFAVAAPERDETEEEQGRFGERRVEPGRLQQWDGDRILSQLVASDSLQQVDRAVVAAAPRARQGSQGASGGALLARARRTR